MQSLKSVLRTPFRTLLFFVLTAAVTSFACLGFGMLSSGSSLIDAADKAYTTKAIIEYVDDGYPDASKYSETMLTELRSFDYSLLADNENVLNFERQYEVGGYIEGYSTRSRNNPFGKQGVVKFRYRENTEFGPACMILEAYYRGDSRLKADSIFYLLFDNVAYHGDPGFKLEEGHVYIAAGTFTKGEKNTDALLITPYDNPKAPDNELFDLPVWDITEGYDDEKYKESEEYGLFMQIVEAYNVMNNYICVLPTNDVSSASAFIMQQTNLLDDGSSRAFTQDEYAAGAKAIIISQYVAKRMGVSVNDTVRLSLYTGGRDGSFAKDSFWPDGGYAEQGDYTVVGIFKENTNLNNTAYIPYPVGSDSWLPEDSVCYTVAEVKLKNGTADRYTEAIEPYLLSAMRVSVFDQGYSQTIAPILAMRQTAVLLSIISAVCCFVLLVLFAYLNFSKHKDAAAAMLSLGSGKARALAYILICVFLIAAAASAVGAAIGYRLSEKVTEVAYARAEQTTTVDNRFSAIYMNDEDVGFELSFKPEVKPIAAVACAVTVAALLLALIIAVSAFLRKRIYRAPIKKKAPRTKESSEIRSARKSSTKPSRKSIFARASLSAELVLNSIKRGGAKNLIVPLAVFVMIVFIGVFARQISTSGDRINEVYDNSSVYAYYTTSVGKRADTLSMKEEDFADAASDPHVEEIYLTSVRYAKLCGYKKAGTDEWIDRFEPEIPGGGFALELEDSWGKNTDKQGEVENFALISMLNDMVNYDKVVFTSSIKNSPEFMFENELHIEYLEGYDADSFKGDECICALPETYMRQLGCELGDTVSICVFTSDDEYVDTIIYDALIAASFEKAVSKNNIYMPLSYNVFNYYLLFRFNNEYDKGTKLSIRTPEEMLKEWTQYGGHYDIVTEHFPFSSVAFKLTDLRTLKEYKDKLIDIGYSPVGSFGKARSWIVVKDNFLNETIVELNRHISYMTLLFIVVYILAAAIGFVLSYLLTKSRKSELAMMRSMGTGKTRTFLILLLEQLVLSIIGGLLGILAVWLFYGELLMLQWQGAAGFFVCYWAGAVISAFIMNRVDVIRILSAKD